MDAEKNKKPTVLQSYDAHLSKDEKEGLKEVIVE
jgi:hypothetical protein